jgi:hypothetical protein
LNFLLGTLANLTEVDMARGLLSTDKPGFQSVVISALGLLAATDVRVNRVNSA